MPAVSDLIIELDRLETMPAFLGALRDEFTMGGLTTGRFAVGDIAAEPAMIYLLWHDSGQVPFSMLARRECFKDEDGTRAMARDFLGKWRSRQS